MHVIIPQSKEFLKKRLTLTWWETHSTFTERGMPTGPINLFKTHDHFLNSISLISRFGVLFLPRLDSHTPLPTYRYSDVIQHPMDLHTVQVLVRRHLNYRRGSNGANSDTYWLNYPKKLPNQQKLSLGMYRTPGEFKKDVLLIFNNCLVFNLGNEVRVSINFHLPRWIT